MDADQILQKSMKIAGDFCVYTNHNLIVERLDNAVKTVTKEEQGGAISK